jgi:hypothetical protein
MQRLNLELQDEKAPVERVARSALADLGLLPGIPSAAAPRRGASEEPEGWFAYVIARRSELLRLTRQHVVLTAVAMLLGVASMVPLALLLERSGPAVLLIGTATLAAFIGAGGLGEPIIAGVQLVDTRRILFGAIPAALLAVLADALLGAVERVLSPRGLRVDESPQCGDSTFDEGPRKLSPGTEELVLEWSA